MIIENEYNIGDFVYSKTDSDQKKRMITGFCVRPEAIIYYASCDGSELSFYAFELSRERDILLTTTS